MGDGAMTEQPEALRLADALDAGENFYAESSLWYDRKLSNAVSAAAAELRRLHEYELAYKTWNEKTQWVQDTLQPGELGLHRADGMKRRIERLHSVNAELLEALRLAVVALAHATTETAPGLYDDAYNKVSAAIAKAEKQP
jgi:hypothetical protein